MTAPCARCALSRHALAPLNHNDCTAWAQLGSRCQCQQRGCQAVQHRGVGHVESTPPGKHQARDAWVTPKKAAAAVVSPSTEVQIRRSSDVPVIVSAACKLLDDVVCLCPQQTTTKYMYGAIFHSVSVPDISASLYLSRHLLRLGLAMKEDMTEATVLHLLVLLDRLHTAQSRCGFHLCTANVHRVLLALSVISAKLVDDEPYTNAYWASCGGVDLPHLNDLEIYAMKCLDHRLNVSATEMDMVRERLLGISASPSAAA